MRPSLIIKLFEINLLSIIMLIMVGSVYYDRKYSLGRIN